MNFQEKKQKIKEIVNSVIKNNGVYGNNLAARMSYFDGIKNEVQKKLSLLLDTFDNSLDNELNNPKAEKYTTKEYLSNLSDILIINLFFEDFFIISQKEKRAIFLPHCIKSEDECKAEKKQRYYSCAKCYNCNIGEIVDFAINQGYRKDSIFVVKGGSIVPELIKQSQPNAVIGVACANELQLFTEIYKKGKVNKIELPPCQISLLLSYGCSNTHADMEEIKEILMK